MELHPTEPFQDRGTSRGRKGSRYLIAALGLAAAFAGIWWLSGAGTTGPDDFEAIQTAADPAPSPVDLAPARMPTEDEVFQPPPPPVEPGTAETDPIQAVIAEDLSPTPEPTEDEVFRPPLPLVKLGTVVIKALPWAEVTSIVDEDGESYDVGDEPYTPFHRSLPVGTYIVRLENKYRIEAIEERIEVRAGEVEVLTVEFERIDEAAFLKQFEW